MTAHKKAPRHSQKTAKIILFPAIIPNSRANMLREALGLPPCQYNSFCLKEGAEPKKDCFLRNTCAALRHLIMR